MVDEVSDVAFATHISLHELCICSERSQLSGKFLSFVRVTPLNHDGRSRFGEGDRCGASNSG
jgi:hypothetical protein